jgi:hypothetical protein
MVPYQVRYTSKYYELSLTQPITKGIVSKVTLLIPWYPIRQGIPQKYYELFLTQPIIKGFIKNIYRPFLTKGIIKGIEIFPDI